MPTSEVTPVPLTPNPIRTPLTSRCAVVVAAYMHPRPAMVDRTQTVITGPAPNLSINPPDSGAPTPISSWVSAIARAKDFPTDAERLGDGRQIEAHGL